jgi:hypothetical protein
MSNITNNEGRVAKVDPKTTPDPQTLESSDFVLPTKYY